MSRNIAVALLLAGALLVNAVPRAVAHGVRWEDRDQTVTPEREMEIRSVVQSHSRDSGRDYVSLTVQTFEDFDNSRLDADSSEHWALMAAFDVDDDDDFDRILYVDAVPDASGGYTLYGEMRCCKQQYDPDDEGSWALMRQSRGFVRVDRPATDKVRVTFPESALKRGGLDRFRWMVRTVWFDRDGSEECGCTNNSFDYAPARMKVGHT